MNHLLRSWEIFNAQPTRDCQRFPTTSAASPLKVEVFLKNMESIQNPHNLVRSLRGQRAILPDIQALNDRWLNSVSPHIDQVFEDVQKKMNLEVITTPPERPVYGELTYYVLSSWRSAPNAWESTPSADWCCLVSICPFGEVTRSRIWSDMALNNTQSGVITNKELDKLFAWDNGNSQLSLK